MSDLTEINDRLNPAGWPRPRLPYKGTTIPAPWIARMSWNGVEIEPAAIYYKRADPVFRDWLCQVCGLTCPEGYAYAPVTIEMHHGDGELPWGLPGEGYSVSGGPVCSERCCALALAVCPHFAPHKSPHVIRFDRKGTHDWFPDTGRSLLVTDWSRVESAPVAAPAGGEERG